MLKKIYLKEVVIKVTNARMREAVMALYTTKMEDTIRVSGKLTKCMVLVNYTTKME